MKKILVVLFSAFAAAAFAQMPPGKSEPVSVRIEAPGDLQAALIKECVKFPGVSIEPGSPDFDIRVVKSGDHTAVVTIDRGFVKWIQLVVHNRKQTCDTSTEKLLTKIQRDLSAEGEGRVVDVFTVDGSTLEERAQRIAARVNEKTISPNRPVLSTVSE